MNLIVTLSYSGLYPYMSFANKYGIKRKYKPFQKLFAVNKLINTTKFFFFFFETELLSSLKVSNPKT